MLRYSEAMGSDPRSVDAAFYDEMRTVLSEDEITELGVFMFYNLGFHTFFGSLKFYPMFAPDGRLVGQEESARLYGAAPASLRSKEAAE